MEISSFKTIVLLTTGFLHLFSGVHSDDSANKIQNGLFAKSDTERVVVYAGSDAEITQIASGIAEKYQNASRAERIFHFYEEMRQYSGRDTEVLQKYLQENGYKFQANWATNTLVVHNADQRCVQKLAEMAQVSAIRADNRIENDAPKSSGSSSIKYDSQNTAPQPFGIGTAWGVAKIRAREAWSYSTHFGDVKDGKSAVLGHIGAGVWGEHEALKENFRSTDGWADAYNWSPVPVDDDGSGTHQVGIAVGKYYGVGVAPGAQWIACRACSTKEECKTSDLLWCFDWLLCPYNTRELRGPKSYKDCGAGAPDVVLITWYASPGSTEFDRSIAALNAANILVVASVGSYGPECGTISTPADHPNVFGVTGVDENDSNVDSTANGPTRDGRIKPDVAAPSVNIISASTSCPTCYYSDWGTSKAAAHTAGLLLLLVDRCPIPFETAKNVITSASQKQYLGKSDQVCGGIKSDVFPNNFYGYGRIDALESVRRMMTICFTANIGSGGGADGGSETGGWNST